MIGFLVLIAGAASSCAMEYTFVAERAPEALLLKSVAIVAPSRQILECAYHCLLEEEMCDGFQMQNTSSAVCQLFEKICYRDGGPEVYFGKKDALSESNSSSNLALGKPAFQSSIHAEYFPSHGNDGVYPTSNDGFFHTKCGTYGPWWRVDIERIACVTAVYFMNRGHGSTWGRAKNIVVTVSLLEEDIMDIGDNRCGYIDGVAQQFDNLVTCGQPLIGRYVQLQMLDADCLHFYEIEVHGY